MKNLLMNRNPLVRAGASICLTLAVFAVVWMVSKAIIPQGALRMGWGTSLGKVSISQVGLRIFALNALLGVGGFLLLNQWKDARGLAVGYYVLVWRSGIFYGLIRGTNSFTFPYASAADSLRGFLLVGLWELVGLSFVCSSTALLARYATSSSGGFSGLVAFCREPFSFIDYKEAFLLVIGVIMIGLAALAEAVNIVGAI